MNQMKYTTDEYVTDHDIRQFIEGLQLSFFVKECGKVNDYILALMRNPLPASNRTITVTGQGEPPQGLEGVKGVFNILIVYYSLENPREAEETEESTIVKKRLGHHGVDAVYTRRKYGTDVRIQINLNEFEPSVVTANEKRESAKKNTAIDPYIKANDTGFFQLFVDSLMNQPQKETKMNLEQIATELTEMGVTDFWAGMFIYLANEVGYSGEHDVKFEKLSDSIAVSFGECQGEMVTQRVVIEALNQDISINTYTDGAVFLVPVTVTTLKKPTQQTKTRESGATVGKDMAAEEIGKVLLDAGVSPLACKKTVRILIRNGYARVVPDAVVARINGKIDFMFGNHEFAESFSLTENSEELDFVYAISTPSNTGRFVYSVENQKEDEVQKPETQDVKMDSGDLPGDHNEHYLASERFTTQLEAAKLSEQSIRAILHRLFLGLGLKKPGAQSSLICTKDHNLTNVYYSHSGNHVTLGAIENTHTFKDGEVLSYGTGTCDAFFIVDTSSVNSFQEKMIHRHLGVPKLTLNLSNGKSIELPFKKEYVGVAENMVTILLDCDVAMCLSNKDLNSITGPALTDLNETQKDRYFVNGTEYTLEEFDRKVALWKKQGVIPNIE